MHFLPISYLDADLTNSMSMYFSPTYTLEQFSPCSLPSSYPQFCKQNLFMTCTMIFTQISCACILPMNFFVFFLGSFLKTVRIYGSNIRAFISHLFTHDKLITNVQLLKRTLALIPFVSFIEKIEKIKHEQRFYYSQSQNYEYIDLFYRLIYCDIYF